MLRILNRAPLTSRSIHLGPQKLGMPLLQLRQYTTDPADAAKVQSEVEKLQQQLEKATKEIVELKDLYRRSLADAENLRTRTSKELVEQKDYAVTKFAKDLLNCADIMSLALASVPQGLLESEEEHHKELKNLHVGVDMTRKELMKVFEKYGITQFDPMGHAFDFNKHTALFHSPVKDLEPGTVYHVDKKGFMIKDRVLRPASVGVVKGED